MKIKKHLTSILTLGLCFITITSCVSRKKMVYFQDVSQLKERKSDYQTNNLKIRPDDVLTIRVSAPEMEAAIPFNLTTSLASQMDMRGNTELETYLVSDEGTIEFPVIGTLEVQGLTNLQLAEKITERIKGYVQDPIVNVRIRNFQVSVLGEVNNAGTFDVEDDHLTVTKALAMAGDLTIHGRRDNILIVGEDNGEKTYAYLNLTDADVVNSPHYYLRQNDVVYVEPRAQRQQAAGSTGIASTYLGIISVVASLILLITR